MRSELEKFVGKRISVRAIFDPDPEKTPIRPRWGAGQFGRNAKSLCAVVNEVTHDDILLTDHVWIRFTKTVESALRPYRSGTDLVNVAFSCRVAAYEKGYLGHDPEKRQFDPPATDFTLVDVRRFRVIR